MMNGTRSGVLTAAALSARASTDSGDVYLLAVRCNEVGCQTGMIETAGGDARECPVCGGEGWTYER
jgi:hypothetical protein